MRTVSKTDIKDTRLSEEDQMALSSIEDVIADIQKGVPVIIVDDEDRENEGDLIIAAQMATPENINFMAKEGRGLICLPMEQAMVDRLGLELMGRGDNSRHKTAFTVSIEAKEGVTTGISAADRAHTIQTAISPDTKAQDIATPGHVFPLLAREGGVLVRAGHTEAAVDLSRLAGFDGAGVICEIMNDDGSMARLPDLVGFAQRHGLKVGTIADLIAYRRRNECLVEKTYQGQFSSRFGGEFQLCLYVNRVEYAEHVVLVRGDVRNSEGPVFVRMHAVDILDDVLGGNQDSVLHKSMQIIAERGVGVVVILRNAKPSNIHEVLTGTIEAKSKEQQLRDYGIGAQILKDVGVTSMTLLTDKPKNIVGLDGYGLSIDGFEAIRGE